MQDGGRKIDIMKDAVVARPRKRRARREAIEREPVVGFGADHQREAGWLVRVWLGMVCAVVVVSLLPGRVVPAAPVSDGVAHGFVYLALAALPIARLSKRRNAAASALMLVFLGLALEAAQSVIPGRVFAWSDVAANLGGTASGIAVGLLARRIWSPNADQWIQRRP